MSTFDPKSFGRKLRAAREELQLTQVELSMRSAGHEDTTDRISAPYISMLERAERDNRPSEQMLAAISRGLRHTDPWIVREWAGMQRAPDTTATLRAINGDPGLIADDREILSKLYLRLTGQI